MSYDESIWFKLYHEKLRKDFHSPNELTLDPNIKHASVAAIIRLNPNYPSNNSLNAFDILYIRRALKKGDPWSGQIAFPGGRHEGTETLQETAERETMEEIGLDITSSKGDYICIGYCTNQDILRGKYTLRIVSFVFLQCVKQTPKMHLHKKEVDSVSWINLSQFAQKPLHIRDQSKYESHLWKVERPADDKFRDRHSETWSNMMVNPSLNRKIVAINDTTGCHVNLFLEWNVNSFLPTNRFKYAALILRTGIQDNDHWLLWGLTYRMTGYILTAMKGTHYLRYKQSSKARHRLAYSMMFIARNILSLTLQWRSAGIEPYFSSKPDPSKL